MISPYILTNDYASKHFFSAHFICKSMTSQIQIYMNYSTKMSEIEKCKTIEDSW